MRYLTGPRIFDIGILKVTYNKEYTRVISVLAVDHPDVTDDPPRVISREKLIELIKSGKKVLLVRELMPGRYAPLTNVDIETINGVDYLKATVEHGPFDDLG